MDLIDSSSIASGDINSPTQKVDLFCPSYIETQIGESLSSKTLVSKSIVIIFLFGFPSFLIEPINLVSISSVRITSLPSLNIIDLFLNDLSNIENFKVFLLKEECLTLSI